MKIILIYTLWIIITALWSALKDNNKRESIFRFVFTFFVATLLLFILGEIE